MRISAFTFIKNGQILGYPFLQSINSILPLVDEFVINVGKSEDNTLELIKSIRSKKIRIIESVWSDNMTNKGFVYGQQKMIAQYNCTGDWLFYIEGDEVYHENDIKFLYDAMERYKNDKKVEALAVNFLHFYGNGNTILDSPGWYRSEARIIKASIRSYAPDGLFWLVLQSNKKGRYPRAKLLDVYCYHYGWVRSEDEMNLKSQKVQKYWGTESKKIDYKNMDSSIFREFTSSHPKIIRSWLPKAKGFYRVDRNYKPTKKQKKHRFLKKIERFTNFEFSKKHYIKV